MDDNATCHRKLTVQDCLTARVYNKLRMASAFSRSKPIEKMCGCFGGGKFLVVKLSSDKQEHLYRALAEEWDKLPQQLLDNVVQSMVRRVECSITLHGGHIPY
ncbi:hypothetical protein TNCV_2332171 [Trichonephila clavipes]|nr:hypothetical protein TNCV_2332171 [Trichonephila clavipes]